MSGTSQAGNWRRYTRGAALARSTARRMPAGRGLAPVPAPGAGAGGAGAGGGGAGRPGRGGPGRLLVTVVGLSLVLVPARIPEVPHSTADIVHAPGEQRGRRPAVPASGNGRTWRPVAVRVNCISPL